MRQRIGGGGGHACTDVSIGYEFFCVEFKGSFSCTRGFSLINFERGLKKNYGLPNFETLCSYYFLLETDTVLILCKNIESFLRYD